MNKLFIGDCEVGVKRSIFPGGEVYVKVDEVDNPWGEVEIKARLQDSADVLDLFMLTDAARRLWGYNITIDLVMPYLPYARQDRVCRVGESHSLRVFCDMINNQDYTSVEVWDCHSEVGLALLDRCYHREQDSFVDLIPLDFSNVVHVAPDAGALKKVKNHVGLIIASKERGEDGSITNTTLNSITHIGNKDFLIIDDICDGGRTFTELAKKLKPLTNGKVLLYTTHGIYSKGLAPMLPYIDHFYTANPWARTVDEDLITII